MTSKKKVKYYFAYNSPYAFLASTRIEKELEPYDVELEYRPLYSPRTGSGGPDINSPKRQYMFRDVARFADAYGLTLAPGPFADTGPACRGFFFAEEKGAAQSYHHGVYAARWLETKDIGNDAVLADVAVSCGLDREEFLAALDDPRYDRQLSASNSDGKADEVFGVPTFVYEGEKFWGNDRIEWLVRSLAR